MRFWVAIGISGLALAGCGAETERAVINDDAPATAASSAKAPAACDVLTQADAATVLGRDVTKMKSDGGPAGLDMCQYGYSGERIMDSGQATVTVYPVDLGSLRKGVLDQGYKVEPVPGLGDEAFWSEEAGLYVGKGDKSAIYLVGVGGAGPADNKRRAIDLATATVTRL